MENLDYQLAFSQLKPLFQDTDKRPKQVKSSLNVTVTAFGINVLLQELGTKQKHKCCLSVCVYEALFYKTVAMRTDRSYKMLTITSLGVVNDASFYGVNNQNSFILLYSFFL